MSYQQPSEAPTSAGMFVLFDLSFLLWHLTTNWSLQLFSLLLFILFIFVASQEVKAFTVVLLHLFFTSFLDIKTH